MHRGCRSAGGVRAAKLATARAVVCLHPSPLKDEIARMTSLSPQEIEVHATKAMIRVVLVNTGYNHALCRLPDGVTAVTASDG